MVKAGFSRCWHYQWVPDGIWCKFWFVPFRPEVLTKMNELFWPYFLSRATSILLKPVGEKDISRGYKLARFRKPQVIYSMPNSIVQMNKGVYFHQFDQAHSTNIYWVHTLPEKREIYWKFTWNESAKPHITCGRCGLVFSIWWRGSVRVLNSEWIINIVSTVALVDFQGFK